jgi:hypothetical protein
MCTGNAATPLIAANNWQVQKDRQEKRQQKRQEERQAEYDAIAERRQAKEEAFDAEMKTMRQDARQERQEARQEYRAQESAPPTTQGGSYQVQSTTAQSTQAVVGQNSGLQAPGAALSGRKGRRAGRRADASSSLRMGPASTGSGAGPNVAV